MGLAGRAARLPPRREFGVFRMSRAGRKRKNGPRHAGGQLKKDKQPDDRVRTSRQPHRRALAHEMRAEGADDLEVKKAAGSEEAESPIGRLWLTGMLADKKDHDVAAARDRYDAAEMYAQIVGSYRSVIEAPRDVAGSGRGFPCLDLLCTLAPENCECARRKGRYDRAYGTLRRLGVRELRAVNQVAVQRGTIEPSELVYLVAGLEGLRALFGLTGRRKPTQYRNTK
jgi:hypothetical protein